MFLYLLRYLTKKIVRNIVCSERFFIVFYNDCLSLHIFIIIYADDFFPKSLMFSVEHYTGVHR